MGTPAIAHAKYADEVARAAKSWAHLTSLTTEPIVVVWDSRFAAWEKLIPREQLEAPGGEFRARK